MPGHGVDVQNMCNEERGLSLAKSTARGHKEQQKRKNPTTASRATRGPVTEDRKGMHAEPSWWSERTEQRPWPQEEAPREGKDSCSEDQQKAELEVWERFWSLFAGSRVTGMERSML